MAIIIEEFELVVEPAEEPQKRGGGEGEEQPAGRQQTLLRPSEIVEAVRLHAERMERVRAD